MSRPHILYLHSHDTGRYISPYGFKMPTPHMQQFAEAGVVFRQAYNAAPTCSPSRAALLTGSSPHSCGQLGLTNRGFNLRDPHKHLCHTLKQAGYRTALFGVTHVHENVDLLGYDQRTRFQVADRYTTDAGVEQVVDFLRQDHAAPFFASIGFFETHRAFPAPDPALLRAGIAPPVPLPDTPETRRDMAAYATMVRKLDDHYGRILHALEDTGLAENTLVVMTTDHGLAFPRMKCCLTDHGMGVLLMLRGPGFDGGRTVDGLVSQIDLFPTLCDYLDMPRPDWLEGRSLLPLVDGSRAEVNEEIFAEVTYHAAYEPQRAVRTRRYKYIRRYGREDTPPMANIDAGESKDVMLAYGLRERPADPVQLYDLIWDPHEMHNLAPDPGHQEVLADMSRRLDVWMTRTGDPLLQGPVPAPAGAYLNPHSHLHPHEAPQAASGRGRGARP